MKPKAKSKTRLGANARSDKRFRHGFESKAFKLYKKLDREFRNCSDPTLEMYDQLGIALLNALNTVSRAMDVRNRDSWDRYSKFVKTDVTRTRIMLQEAAARNFRIANAQQN